jgi:hypothetical protein
MYLYLDTFPFQQQQPYLRHAVLEASSVVSATREKVVLV